MPRIVPPKHTSGADELVASGVLVVLAASVVSTLVLVVMVLVEVDEVIAAVDVVVAEASRVYDRDTVLVTIPSGEPRLSSTRQRRI